MRDSKVDFEERDYSKKPLSAEELDALIGDRPVTEFLSTRNEVYKARKMDQKPPSRAEAIELVLKHPNLLRRPILIKGKRQLTGFKPEQWEEFLRS